MKLHEIFHGLLFMAGHRAVAAPPPPEPAVAGPPRLDARGAEPYATWSRHRQAGSAAPPCAGEPTACG